MVVYILHGNEDTIQVKKCEAVARFCGVKLTYRRVQNQETAPAYEPCPVLDTVQGSITGSNPICYFLAGVNSLRSIGDHFTTARALSFLDAVVRDIEVAYYRRVVLGIEGAVDELRKIFDALDQHFMKVSYCVGERRSYVDVALNAVVVPCVEFCPMGVNLQRFLRTMSSETKANNGRKNFFQKKNDKRKATKSNENKPVEKATDEKVADEKAADKPAEAAVSETVSAGVTMGPNFTDIPHASFPQEPTFPTEKSEFDLEEWKRQYSNAKDLENEAMAWFFENYKHGDYVVYRMMYDKLEDECTVPYLASNMLGGFLQRIDPSVRKHTFGITRVYGQPKDYNYEGVFVFRGDTMPKVMLEHPSFEYHKWAKMDLNNEEHKKVFTDILCSEEKTLDGVPIVDFKQFK